MSPSTFSPGATVRQLRFLKSLAERTGTSFTYPKSRREASSEIDRLIQLRDSGHAPSPEIMRADDRSPVYATAVAPDEVSGYGSSASWRTNASESVTTAPQPPKVGERTELARYSVSSGERIIYGQRINGTVRITDRPASGDGRSYLVERELEQDGYSALKALVADYIEQANRLDDVPMASSTVRRELEQLRTDA
jgi:hypothetical protein